MNNQDTHEHEIAKIRQENKLLHAELKRTKEKSEEQRLEIVKMMVEIEKDNTQLSELNTKIKQNYNRMTKLIQRIIELKEPGYVEHTEKMIQAADYIAQKLNLDPASIEHLKMAIFIHEIGKIAIPDRLINTNESELTKDEKNILHQQSLIGSRVLELEEGLEEVAKIIRHMNEHIDGSGVPDGLTGSQIPVESKIILVVDTFNSLIYKKKNLLNPKEALNYMEKYKGTLFDDVVVSHIYSYVKDEELIHGLPEEVAISIAELNEDMELTRDLYTSNNVLLAPKGSRLTEEGIKMIKKFHARDPILRGVYISV